MPAKTPEQPKPTEIDRVTVETREGGSITIEPETAQPEAEENA